MATHEVRRDRLISLLEQRWATGVTVVVGGPGIGKSTAVRHAHLDSLAMGRGPELLIDARTNAAPQVPRSMRSVIVDHADHASLDGLHRLLETVPHVTIVARRWPDLRLEQHHLDGDLHVIHDEHLLFSPDEWSSAPLPLQDWDGWVGAARLAADLGDDAVRRFVRDETREDQHALLDLVIASGSLSDAAAATLMGRPASVSTELADIPTLRSRTVDGRRVWSVGRCWEQLRPPMPTERADHAVRVLIDTELTRDAAAFARHATPDSLADVQRAVALDRLSVGQSTLKQLANTGEHSAATALLKGYVARTESPRLDRSITLWREAVSLADREGDSILAIEALAHLAGPLYMKNDHRGAVELLEGAHRHIAHAPELQQVLVQLATLLASPDFGQDPGDPDRLRELEHPDLPAHWHGLWHHLMAWTLLTNGHSEAAMHIAAASADAMPFETVHGIERLILFRSGLLVPELNGAEATVGTLTVSALIAAVRGRDQEARALLDRARQRSPSFRTLEVDLPLGLTEAIIMLRTEGVSASRATLRSLMDEFGGSGRASTWFDQVPWLFATCDIDIATGAEGGDLTRRDRTLASALSSCRDGRETDHADAVGDYGARDLVAALGLHGAVELALACAHGNHQIGKPLVASLFTNEGERAREEVRDLASRPSDAFAETARRMLAQVAVPPREPYRLHLLGNQFVACGDDVVDHPNWRREQVRALLALIAVYGRTTRDRLSVILWPDVDKAAAKNRLRTTLNRLMVALESSHRPREASPFLRLTDDEITLDLNHISIDAHEFEEALDRAAALDRAGCRDEALVQLRIGLQMWNGDYLEDQRYEDWAMTERARMVARFANASLRAGELLEAAGHLDEALRTVSRLIVFEPWSEPAHRALIRLHVAAGNNAAARRAAAHAEATLREIGGAVEPLSDLIG